MVTNKCWACGQDFEAARQSRLCCSIECRKMYQSDYDRGRYEEFRDANRKRKREMLKEKYSISSTNIYKLQSVCDECLTKFYHDQTIFESFEGNFTTSYNTTQWGAAVCPNCGLVEKSACDEQFKPAAPANDIDRKTYLMELHRVKKPNISLQAIYSRNHIDFIAEAEAVRKMINKIINKGELTKDQINLCIATFFRKIKESK